MQNGSTPIVANKTSKGKFLVKLTMCFVVLSDNYKLVNYKLVAYFFFCYHANYMWFLMYMFSLKDSN